MALPFDINLLSFYRQVGKDIPELPGLYIAEMPRRPARSRSSDRLILYLSLAGNDPLSSGKLEQLLAQLAHTYYRTSGSVTAALRTVAELLNHSLLERNVRSANSGRQSLGWLTQAVFRGEQFYLAQSGPVHAFLSIGGELQHLYDPQISGRGLGLSRTTPVRYFTASLQPGDTILLAAQPSPGWSAGSLTGLHAQPVESIRKRLLSQADLELNAALLQVRQGTGKIHWIQFKPAGEPLAPADPVRASESPNLQQPPAVNQNQMETLAAVELPAAVEQPEAPAPEVGPLAPSPDGGSTETIPTAAESFRTAAPSSAAAESLPARQGTGPVELRAGASISGSNPRVQVQNIPKAAPADAGNRVVTGPAPANAQTARPEAGVSSEDVVRTLKKAGQPFATTFSALVSAIRTLIVRMLPDESLFTIPSSAMALIAIAVPVVVVAVAGTVYVQRGVTAQYQAFMEQAKVAVAQAEAQTDPMTQRVVWDASLQLIDKAESYRSTEESRDLRLRAQNALDSLNLVKRLGFSAAITGGLPDNVSITQIVAGDEDLYLLDGNQGNVLRARATTSGKYELDNTFQCGPAAAGTTGVGPLIDIANPPPGKVQGAVVLGMDQAGTMLYCFTDRPPQPVTLTPPRTTASWGNLKGFSLDVDQDNLYVLDPSNSAVWIYWGGEAGQEPAFFFGDDVPNMADVIDIAVDKRDLYLLHADGSITMCTYSSMGVAPTRCSDPAIYVDARPGLEGKAFIPERPFTRVLTSLPPDPSLFLLEPQEQAVYHFSLRTLTFHRRFEPQARYSTRPVTAFAVEPLRRILYVAMGNNIYQATMP